MPKFAVQILGFKKDIDSEKTIVKIRNWSIRLLYSVYLWQIDILPLFILIQLAVTINWFEFKLLFESSTGNKRLALIYCDLFELVMELTG